MPNMDLEEYKEELKPLIKGASFIQLYQTLLYISIFRYPCKEHLQAVKNPNLSKIATPKKLQVLTDLGYIEKHPVKNLGDIFTAKEKSLQLLELTGYRRTLLPDPPPDVDIYIPPEEEAEEYYSWINSGWNDLNLPCLDLRDRSNLLSKVVVLNNLKKISRNLTNLLFFVMIKIT